MVAAPQIDPVAKIEFSLPGKILYEGKRDYLPRTLAGVADSDLTLKYTYDVVYGKDKTEQAAVLYNPLTILGFPIGEDMIAASGKLEIARGDELLKTYTATCGFEKTRNLFYEGDTFAELRLRALACVRENIEAQMQGEREFLSKLIKTQ